MLRPHLSSTIFTRPHTPRRRQRMRMNVVSVDDNESTRLLHDIELRIERTRGHCSNAYGRQEKAYIKVISDLEKERLEILKGNKEKVSNSNNNDSCTD